ncbi:MAG: glycoside hydrolase [Acidobacteria bacterium]|nr:glycoside hydrolase [Acidobacteriota bacterium]
MKRACFSLILLCAATAYAQSLTQLEQSFRKPPPDARIMMRWWWFGPVADTAEIEREMRKMKDGGIGGFEVQPVYPLVLDNGLPGITNKPFLSPEHLKALRFTADKARELGLRMDLTLGSGWPYGGPSIPITQAAPRLLSQSVPATPGAEAAPTRLRENDTVIAAYLANSAGEFRELPVSNGKARVPANITGPHTVNFFISSHTRQMVKRASAGAEGLVLDHYNRAALDNFLTNVAGRVLKPLEGRMPYAVFCDSLEVFGSDWTPDLFTEFQSRRGYDLRPYLPALSSDIGEKTGAIRNDWLQTLAELAEERFLKPLHDFARDRGVKLRVQDYGTPPVTLSSQQYVDLPEGEEPHWKRFTPTKWASSGSHLFDRPVTSSETWTWLHSPSFRATPLDMKVEADRHFLIGINQLIGHGWPYSPPEAGEPGWRFYASAVFNHHNPWWIVMPDVTAYLQRVSYLLRQGKPANDVALYLPIADARANITLGRATIDRSMNPTLGTDIIPQILESGYQYDAFDDGTSDRVAGRYPIVILPNIQRIPVATYRRLEEYVSNGGKLIATKRTPSLSPGLTLSAEESEEIRNISARLFTADGHKGVLVADEGLALRETLHKLRAPDVALAPPRDDIGFLHRTLPGAEIYFIANTGNRHYSGEATFRVNGMSAETWYPMSGQIQSAAALRAPDGRSKVKLDLPAYDSIVLVFTRRKLPPAPQTSRLNIPVDLSKDWKVTIAGKPVLMAKLASWTEIEGARFFSGVAVYERTFRIGTPFTNAVLSMGESKLLRDTQPEGRPGMRAWIEAPVRDAAVVYLNGKRAGSVWRPPYNLDISGFLKAGANTIRIEVANTAINRLAEGPLPDYKALKAKYGDRFQPQDMDNLMPLPSGLLGQISILGGRR